MSRSALLAVLLCCTLPGPAHAAAPTGLGSWDRAEQRAVVRAGLMADRDSGGFGGAERLSGAELTSALAQLGLALGTPAVDAGDDPTVTVAGFDRLLVRQLGLGDVASAIRAEAGRAGLEPPYRFGSEVVARYLGLRFDHPFPAGEKLELSPGEPITRAEAAWSLSRVLRFGGWERDSVRAAFAEFALPDYTPAQLAALRVAVSKIGMPYIWGGETDGVSYGQDHGGYDCSGFVWRVFKLTNLVTKIDGRTAEQMSLEIPKRERLSYDELQPGDLMFFDRPAGHVAIVLGGGWLINSSSQGVFVQRMDSRGSRFSWGRRVL
jgi:cell wall-associated NlpC family hydrolase